MSGALPADHALRVQLNNEVHARPPEPLHVPARVSYLSLLCDTAQQDASFCIVSEAALNYGVAAPVQGARHFSAEFGGFRLKWERHAEFVRYTFITSGDAHKTALMSVPADWVASFPGTLLIATHLALVPAHADTMEVATRQFPHDSSVGSVVAEGAATVFTDFRILPDGFNRALVQDSGMSPWQAGRIVQGLLEIDTYRMMALLALPVAHAVGPIITRSEQELARITAAMVTASDTDEPLLLERLTRLAAEIDSRYADNLYRFSAAAAYYELVQRRIQDLREARLPGLQTLQEFIGGRLAPAMSTCQTVAARQEDLSRRVARGTQLLATRVGVTRELQNQALLEAMNRRVRLQLRLQSTVEGLSIAAVTYYIVGLVGHAAEGLEAAGVHVNPSIAMAVCIPIVGGLMAFGLRNLRRHVELADKL